MSSLSNTRQKKGFTIIDFKTGKADPDLAERVQCERGRAERNRSGYRQRMCCQWAFAFPVSRLLSPEFQIFLCLFPDACLLVFGSSCTLCPFPYCSGRRVMIPLEACRDRLRAFCGRERESNKLEGGTTDV